MTSAQVVEMSVTNNSSFQNYPHPSDHTMRTTDTPGFKPFTMYEGCRTLVGNQFRKARKTLNDEDDDTAEDERGRNNISISIMLNYKDRTT